MDIMDIMEIIMEWLRGCGVIDPGKRFGVDWLGDEPGALALAMAPSPLKWRENLLGERCLDDAQAMDFIFAVRSDYGADPAQNLANLALCQAVATWIAERNAAGDFPEWEGVVVTGVTPTLIGTPEAFGAGSARYEVRFRMDYRVNRPLDDMND